MTTSVTSTTSSTSASSVTTAASAAGAKPLDREAFLKLLVAQISHQDPLKPMEGTEFVSQLSQFAMVEQAISQSNHLDNLSSQLGGIANNDATALTGKKVTMRGQTMAFDGITATRSAVTLSGPASTVSAEVVDSNGKVVRTIDIGARPGGVVSVTWDGKDASGQSAAKGTYTLRVKATTAEGKPVSVTQDVTGTVTKISFEKGYPELTLDTGATGPISDLVSVEAPAAAPTTNP
jgi:flagellar basal-body rod modification protein FlgD